MLLDGWLREKMDSERQETVSKPVKKRKGPVTKTESVIHKSIFCIASTVSQISFSERPRRQVFESYGFLEAV